ASAQEKNPEQIGLVFPAFFNSSADIDPNLGQSVAFALKLTVQSHLSQEDPFTGERGYGRGISFYVPAQMAEPSHGAAARLARISGLQGTVWGVARELIDGIAIQSFLTLSPRYEDYRDSRQEYWQVEIDGQPLELGPPQMALSFLSETVPSDLVTEFGDPAEIDYCPVDGGNCISFPDAQIARVLSVADDGSAIILRERMRFNVNLPRAEIYNSEVVDYANLYMAYARGNLNQAILLADTYIERHGPSGTAIDAHLYKAAALARTERFKEAFEEISDALELNPIAQRSLRYGIMLELAQHNGLTDRSEELFSRLDANYALTDPFDQVYAKLR
ncbi:MAG: hypothetical protein AAFY15_08975, partial [Cyanobacteria bacterium J06648_11]